MDRQPITESTLNLMTPPQDVARVGVILIGEMRFANKNHLKALESFLYGTDVYVSTYEEWQWFADRLSTSNFTILYNESTVKDISRKIEKYDNHDRMWQWIQLNDVLQTYKERLAHHEVILRTRVDANWICHHRAADLVAERNDTTYKERDFWFYAEARHFLNTWSSFWNLTLTEYMNPNNTFHPFDWNHLLDAPETLVADWKKLLLPSIVVKDSFGDTLKAIRDNIQKLNDTSVVKTMSISGKVKPYPWFASEQLCMTRAIQSGYVITPYNYSLMFPARRFRKNTDNVYPKNFRFGVDVSRPKKKIPSSNAVALTKPLRSPKAAPSADKKKKKKTKLKVLSESQRSQLLLSLPMFQRVNFSLPRPPKVIDYDFRSEIGNRHNCYDHPFSIESPRDGILGNCTTTRNLWNAYKPKYGRRCTCGSNVLQFVEVPKTASTTVKRLMQKICKQKGCTVQQGYDNLTPQDTSGFFAFSIVRHPVQRFLSGYGTVIKRLKDYFLENPIGENDKRIRAIMKLNEPRRFREFVDFFLSPSYGINMIKNEPNILAHTFSSSFFWNLYPGKIHSIGRTESAEKDLEALLKDVLKMKLKPNKVRMWANYGEGQTNVKNSLNASNVYSYYLNNERKSIDKLNNHFATEISALGYNPV